MTTDSYGRRIDYLRVSLTDRCNLRCVYCMPETGVEWKSPGDILAFEEVERFARIAVGEGISKIRLTGGEPLVRKGVVDHIRRLTKIAGVEAIALTTNGTLLAAHADALADAGLERVNISLDSLDPEVFARITRGGVLAHVLAGLDSVMEAGMRPVKLNVVVVRSLDQDVVAFARMTVERPVHVRFIEYMPVGRAGRERASRGGAWSEDDHVPSSETLARLRVGGAKAGFGRLAPIVREDAPGGWGPARYYRFGDAPGTVGVISPMSHHFCAECNRLRLTADGRLRTCLFADAELDVRRVVREGTDEEIGAAIRSALAVKPEHHIALAGTARAMSQIGG